MRQLIFSVVDDKVLLEVKSDFTIISNITFFLDEDGNFVLKGIPPTRFIKKLYWLFSKQIDMKTPLPDKIPRLTDLVH